MSETLDLLTKIVVVGDLVLLLERNGVVVLFALLEL